MPRSGRLNKVVELQRFVESKDEMGQKVKQWTKFATVWVGIEEFKVTENFTEDQINTASDVMIVMRYRSDIDTTCRIVYTDRSGFTRTYEVIKESGTTQAYRESKFECRQMHNESVVDGS